MKRFLFLILAVLSPLALWAQVPNQLVTISSDGKHLLNSITGQPVFLNGRRAATANASTLLEFRHHTIPDRPRFPKFQCTLGDSH